MKKRHLFEEDQQHGHLSISANCKVPVNRSTRISSPWSLRKSSTPRRRFGVVVPGIACHLLVPFTELMNGLNDNKLQWFCPYLSFRQFTGLGTPTDDTEPLLFQGLVSC